MTFTEAQSGALDIAVKNDVRLFSKSRTEMGRVVLRLSDLADISKPTMAWYDGLILLPAEHADILFIQ